MAGVPLIACIGVPAEERAVPQTLVMDLTLDLDLEAATNTDDLSLSVDYKELVNRMQVLASETACQLLETLAARLCRAALEDSKIAAVHMTIRKFPSELAGQVDYVAVELSRSNR